MNNQTVRLNVCGQVTEVEIQRSWQTIAPVTTKGRWQVGCGPLPFDNFEVRDSRGTLIKPDAAIGDWLRGTTLHINLLAGIGD